MNKPTAELDIVQTYGIYCIYLWVCENKQTELSVYSLYLSPCLFISYSLSISFCHVGFRVNKIKNESFTHSLSSWNTLLPGSPPFGEWKGGDSLSHLGERSAWRQPRIWRRARAWGIPELPERSFSVRATYLTTRSLFSFMDWRNTGCVSKNLTLYKNAPQTKPTFGKWSSLIILLLQLSLDPTKV